MLHSRRPVVFALLRFQALLAALLFVPAGTLRFWEGWVWWGLVGAGVWGIAAYFLQRDPALIRRRMRLGPAAETEPGQKVIQSIAGLLGCVLLVVAAEDHQVGVRDVPALAVVAADLCVALALWLVFRVLDANRWAAGVVQVEPGQPVISSGPYARIRHPMYAGSMLGFLATAPALGSLRALVPAALLCAAVIARLLHEERFLSRALPGYAEYCRTVPRRLIPGIW